MILISFEIEIKIATFRTEPHHDQLLVQSQVLSSCNLLVQSQSLRPNSIAITTAPVDACLLITNWRNRSRMWNCRVTVNLTNSNLACLPDFTSLERPLCFNLWFNNLIILDKEKCLAFSHDLALLFYRRRTIWLIRLTNEDHCIQHFTWWGRI